LLQFVKTAHGMAFPQAITAATAYPVAVPTKEACLTTLRQMMGQQLTS
jgi:hypothetical protein